METPFVAIGKFIYWRGDLLLEIVGGNGDKQNTALGIAKVLNEGSDREKARMEGA